MEGLSITTILAIVKFGIEEGVPAVQKLLDGYNKEKITDDDWDELMEAWGKPPEDYRKS